MPLPSRPSHLLDLLRSAHHALLIFKDDRDYGERVLSTQTLRTEAELLAEGFAASGVGAGDEIMLLLSEPLHVLSAFWACLILGAVPLIAPVEHDLLSRMLPHLSPRRVLVDQIMEQTSRSLFSPPFDLLNIIGMRASTRRSVWHRPASTHDVALRVVSFDMTHAPTILPLTHHNVLSTLVQHIAATHINSRSILVNWMPLSSFSALCAGHFAALLQHAAHVLLSSYTFPDDPLLWLHTLHQHRATHAIASRAVTSLVYHHITPADLNDLDLSSLVSVWLGPEPLSSRDTYEFSHLLGRAYVKPSVMQTGYALSQGALCSTCSRMEDALCLLHLDRHALAQGRVMLTSAGSHAVALLSMGRAVVGCTVRLVDEQDHVLPDRMLGEVVISGPGVPCAQDERWYHTETIGFVHEQNLYILGQRQDRYTCLDHMLYACDLEAIVEHHFFSLDGPVAVVDYPTLDQQRHLLMLVCCRLEGEERDRELVAMRAHLHKVLPEGCATSAQLSILPIATLDYPHMTTHQLWRHTFRHLIAEGHFDLELAKRALPLPRHSLSDVVAPSTSMLTLSLDGAHIAALFDMLDGQGAPMEITLTLDAHGKLLDVRPASKLGKEDDESREVEALAQDGEQEVHRAAEPTIVTDLGDVLARSLDEGELKRTLLAFPEPPTREEASSQQTSSPQLEHVPSEQAADSEQAPFEQVDESEPLAERESLEEDTQQLWLQDHAPYKSTYPTRQMVGLTPNHIIAVSPVQALFLMEGAPVEIGWMEFVLAMPSEVSERSLHRAIQHVSARHESLRVHLVSVEGGASLQHVQPVMTEPLEFHDLSDLSSTHCHRRTTQILARFRAATHEPRPHRALVHWLALRHATRTDLYVLTHHAVLDERAAYQLLGLVEHTLSQSEDEPLDEDAAGVMPLDQLVADLCVQHDDVNAGEYWTTLFALPYRHVSLRDATFPGERLVLSTLLSRERVMASDHPIEALLCAAFARFIADISPVESDSLIVSVPHDWSDTRAPGSPRPLHVMTSPLPVRMNLSGKTFGTFVSHVQRRMSDAHAHALTPEHIARAANVSRLVASGTRFAFRWQSHDPAQTPRAAAHHTALVAYPTPFLNELMLDCVEQVHGDIMLTLHIGEDVQLRHPTMRVFAHLLEPLTQA